jgi:hypothetical protein
MCEDNANQAHDQQEELASGRDTVPHSDENTFILA